MAAFAVPILASVAGSLISGMMSKKQDAPAAAAPVDAPAAPASQAAQTPTVGAFKSANAASASGGPSSTELSGVGGIDPSILKLGRNTLLGS